MKLPSRPTRSLRTGLSVGMVSLVLVLAALMGVFSTLTLRHTLMERLDTQLVAANDRAAARRHGISAGEAGGGASSGALACTEGKPGSSGASEGRMSDGGAAPGAGDSPSAGASSADTSGSSGSGDSSQLMCPAHSDEPLPPGIDAAGQPTGTLTVIAPGNPEASTREGEGADEGGAPASASASPSGASAASTPTSATTRATSTVVKAAYISDSGTYQALSPAETATLLALPSTDEPVTVDIESLGDYRVLVSLDPASGDRVITGLSMKSDNALIRTQLLVEAGIALIGALAAALVGRAFIRSSLAPLERVAATAQRVATQPLARGEVTIEERVSDADLASSQEVSKVGRALNTLLGHVDDALTQRQRSETQVRQFVADASHELRTPLASIRGYTELIQREGADAGLPTEALHALERVHSESLRMTGLVEDLLLLARLDAGRALRRDEVDLLALALDAVADAQAASPDHHWDLDLSSLPGLPSLDETEDGEANTLASGGVGNLDEEDDAGKADEMGEPPLIVGDEERLRQVFVNLLANARVHTPAGTRVTVRLWQEDGGAAPSTEGAASTGASKGKGGGAGSAGRARPVWKVQVADDGPGIDPAVRDRVFERFARGDASRERRTGSTGLGMSIALAIVRSHGGWIEVDSARAEEGTGRHGTSFTVVLPAAEAE